MSGTNEHVMFYEIHTLGDTGHDHDHDHKHAAHTRQGGSHRAFFRNYSRSPIRDLAGGWRNDFAQNGRHGCTLPDRPGGLGPDDWALVAMPGKHTYMIRLTKETRAEFNAAEPLKCFVDHIPGADKNLLITKHVRVESNCIEFTVDTGAVLDAVEAASLNSGGSGFTITKGSYVTLPLFLNMYDTETKLPVWLAANHAHGSSKRAKSAAGGSHSGMRMTGHGGIHPPDFLSHMYVDLFDAGSSSKRSK